MLHRLKYEGCRHLARPLGIWLGMLLTRETGWPLRTVIPVPLHRRREAQRGYNQSLLIARYTARAMGLPLLHPLIKIRATPAQAGLSRAERRANVSGVFALSGRLLHPGPVLLIDDIYSTGATLKEAAWLFHDRGHPVFAAVAAYNPRLS
jgi:predicted amidophosphoribosyltransferase